MDTKAIETVANMSEKRFGQWARLEALKVAQDMGRAHVKMPPQIMADAELLMQFVETGEVPETPDPAAPKAAKRK